MEYREWLKQLKAGDDVVIRTWNLGGSGYINAKVEKITPTGFIRVEGALYKPKDGMSRSGGSELLNPTDEKTIKLLKEYTEKTFVKQTMYKIRNTCNENITYEQAVEIRKIMGWK